MNRDIAHTLELQEFVELDEMVHKVMKIEQQLKSKVTFMAPFSSSKPVSSTFYSFTFKKDNAPKLAFKERSKGKKDTKEKGKMKVSSSRAKASNATSVKDMDIIPTMALPRRLK